MTSKFDKLNKAREDPGIPGKTYNRYGMTEKEWEDIGTTDRVVHYNRQNVCEHKANMHDWPPDLRESYSMDPYFHTAHMEPCKRWGIKPPQRWGIDCACNMCLGKFGLTEEDMPRKVNEEAVRLKWQQKFRAEVRG